MYLISPGLWSVKEVKGIIFIATEGFVLFVQMHSLQNALCPKACKIVPSGRFEDLWLSTAAGGGGSWKGGIKVIWGNCCTFDIFVLGKISDAQPWGQDEGFNPVKLYLNRFIVKLGTILIYILQKVFTFSAVQFSVSVLQSFKLCKMISQVQISDGPSTKLMFATLPFLSPGLGTGVRVPFDILQKWLLLQCKIVSQVQIWDKTYVYHFCHSS